MYTWMTSDLWDKLKQFLQILIPVTLQSHLLAIPLSEHLANSGTIQIKVLQGRSHKVYSSNYFLKASLLLLLKNVIEYAVQQQL